MKKLIVAVIVVLTCFSAFSLGRSKQIEIHDFDSIPMLESFYIEEDEVSNLWNDVKISLITLTQDDPLYSWFGHTGMLVEYPDGFSSFYDYGRFAFSKSFYINFVKGLLWFGCGCFNAEYEFSDARTKQRTVSKVELNLTKEQKSAIVNFLGTNSSYPYNKYLYNHYSDNCATRIRDIINYATHGDFEAWAKKQPGMTCRAQTSRILYRNIPIEWVLDFMQGPSVDANATLWEEMFLPGNLEKALVAYGKLGTDISFIEDFRETEKRPEVLNEARSYSLQSLIAGIVLAVLALFFAKYCKTGYIIETAVINFLLAIAGSLLFYLMFCSGHSFAWNNENILFVNPLLFIPAVMGLKYRKHSKTLTVFYGLFAATAILIFVLKIIQPGLLIQANIPQLLTLLPYYTANFIICLTKRD